MAPKTRSVDNPPDSPPASPDLGSPQSSVSPTPATLALVLQQMALINARLDAQSAAAAAAVAAGPVAAPADPSFAVRRHDAQLDPHRDNHSLNLLSSDSPTHASPFPGTRLDAQPAHDAAFAAASVGDPHVALRRHDAHTAPQPHLPAERLPPPPPYPLAGYALPDPGPFFPEAPPPRVPASRGHPHPYGPPLSMAGHSPFPGGPPSPFPGGPPPPFPGWHSHPPQRGGHTTRGGRRPTIDPVVIGRAAHEATGFDKDALNRSMKMSVPTMGPTTDFKQWKRNFLNFLSLKAAYLISQPAIRESCV